MLRHPHMISGMKLATRPFWSCQSGPAHPIGKNQLLPIPKLCRRKIVALRRERAWSLRLHGHWRRRMTLSPWAIQPGVREQRRVKFLLTFFRAPIVPKSNAEVTESIRFI